LVVPVREEKMSTQMSEDDEEVRRVRFFGSNDLATGLLVQRAAGLAEQFDAENPPTNTVDVLELHNVLQYLEHDFLPSTYSEERKALVAWTPMMR
jgi:hypothetical protein